MNRPIVFAALAFVAVLAIVAFAIPILGGLLHDRSKRTPAPPVPTPPDLDVPHPAPRLVATDNPRRPERDPVIGSDDHTAARHARLRSFQQRETAIRAARSSMTRGF